MQIVLEDEVKKMMKDFGMEYPVCIDTADREGSWFGKLFQAYRIGMLPQVFVVDRDGRIESHGTLADALEAARKLAAK